MLKAVKVAHTHTRTQITIPLDEIIINKRNTLCSMEPRYYFDDKSNWNETNKKQPNGMYNSALYEYINGGLKIYRSTVASTIAICMLKKYHHIRLQQLENAL